jgi:hypothetical protein
MSGSLTSSGVFLVSTDYREGRPLYCIVFNIIINAQCTHQLPEVAGRKGSAISLNILVVHSYLIYLRMHIMSQTTDEPLNDLHSSMRTHKKMPLEIHFVYLGSKEIYSTFKTCCIFSVLFHRMPFIL